MNIHRYPGDVRRLERPKLPKVPRMQCRECGGTGKVVCGPGLLPCERCE
jgi:hypothetical protein